MPVYTVVIEITGFTIVVLGIVINGREHLIDFLPRNVVQRLDTRLDEAQEFLRRAEEVGAIPPQSEYKDRLDR